MYTFHIGKRSLLNLVCGLPVGGQSDPLMSATLLPSHRLRRLECNLKFRGGEVSNIPLFGATSKTLKFDPQRLTCIGVPSRPSSIKRGYLLHRLHYFNLTRRYL